MANFRQCCQREDGFGDRQRPCMLILRMSHFISSSSYSYEMLVFMCVQDLFPREKRKAAIDPLLLTPVNNALEAKSHAPICYLDIGRFDVLKFLCRYHCTSSGTVYLFGP